MLLEKAGSYAFGILEIPHEHNPFDEKYATVEGQGIDLKIYTSVGKIRVECKNNNGSYGMSPYWLNRECYSRFKSANYAKKIFLCANLNLSKYTLMKMRACGISPISLGFQVTPKNFNKAIHTIIKKLYWIKAQFNFNPLPSHTKQLPMSNFIRERLFVNVSCKVNESYDCYKHISKHTNHDTKLR